MARSLACCGQSRIFVPLPKVLIDALDACPGKQFPLWTGESKKKSVIGNWQRALKKLFKLAKVPNGHAHRFRHTFAAELLLSGANLTNVAQLLGDSLGEDHRKALQRMDHGSRAGKRSWKPTFGRLGPPISLKLPSQRRHNQEVLADKLNKNKHLKLWRRGELNPRPKSATARRLHA